MEVLTDKNVHLSDKALINLKRTEQIHPLIGFTKGYMACTGNVSSAAGKLRIDMQYTSKMSRLLGILGVLMTAAFQRVKHLELLPDDILKVVASVDKSNAEEQTVYHLFIKGPKDIFRGQITHVIVFKPYQGKDADIHNFLEEVVPKEKLICSANS
ncbi:MAG: hypothetical protein JXA96_08060 [Sedimentisphaerales bacterium]|nr:hypothetical protein [Sedimentisphaerales bacterium]